MKAPPEPSAITTINDRPVRVMDAGKPGLPRLKGKTDITDKQLSPSTGTPGAKKRRPQLI